MGRKKKLSTVTLSIQDLMTQPRRLAGLPMMNKMAGYRVLLSVIGRLQGLWSIAKMPGADKNGQLYLQFETDDFEVVKEKRGVYNEGDILFRLKLKDIVPDNHYKEAREALASMTRIKCYIPDKSNPGYYRTSTLMDIYGEAEKGKNGLEFVGTNFNVVVSNYVAENILDINLFDNYTRFLGYTACRLKSGFSYPLYIYLSEEWRYRGSQFSIPIKNLRERLGFVKDIDDPERETRYMAWSLFCQKVLDQAKKELDDLAKTGGADFTFEYQGLLDGEPLPKYKRPDAVMFTITPTEVGEQLQAENDYIIGKTTLRKILSGFFKLSSSQIIGLMNRVTPAMMPEFEQKIKNLKSEIESKRKSEIKNISAWSYTAVNGIIRELEECFGTRRVVDAEAEEVKTEESSCRDSEVFDNDEEFYNMTEQEYAQQLTDIIRNRHERNGEADEFGNRERIRIAIPNAKIELWRYINDKVGKQQAKGLQCYAKVAEWMTDNNGKGLICHGQCGTGKTLICRHILPLLIEHHARRMVRCYTAQKMVEDLDSILKFSNSIIYIDDVGTEPETTRKYGVERHPFAELCDAAEQNYNLLILSSNLRMIPNPKRPDYPSFLVRYGERTYDRLKALTRTALFIGESMRK